MTPTAHDPRSTALALSETRFGVGRDVSVWWRAAVDICVGISAVWGGKGTLDHTALDRSVLPVEAAQLLARHTFGNTDHDRFTPHGAVRAFRGA